MAKKPFKSKAINAVLSAIIRTLLGWAEEWNEDAFFFLVIGDKTCVDIAWSNTADLECDGAFAIAGDPKTAGAFYNLSAAVDLLIEDNVKDKKFNDIFQETSPSKEDLGWYSIEAEE